MTKRAPCRIVLVGCGAVSQQYYGPALRELERLGEAQVVGLLDPNAEALQKVASTFPQAKACGNLQELLGVPASLAIVASPPRFHREHAITALEAGLAVLCEKPIATSVEDAEAMIAAADVAGHLLAVAHFRRLFPAAETIRRLTADDVLGELNAFSWFQGGYFDWPVVSPSYFTRSTSGGGVLLDIGPHVLDLLHFWFGEPSEVIYEDDAVDGIEVTCRLRLSYPTGLRGEVLLTRDWTRPNNVILRGSKGWIQWNPHEADNLECGFNHLGYRLQSTLVAGNACSDIRIPARNFHLSFLEMIRQVVISVQAGNARVVTGRDSLASLKLIEQCYARKVLMRSPWMSPAEWARAERLARSAKA